MSHVARTSILIVEDESLIAMDLEEMLEELGFRGIVAKPTSKSAETWLATSTPSFAVLDVHLREGTSEKVAEELARRSVPFIVSSGLESTAQMVFFAKGIRVPRPCSLDNLAAALNDLNIFPVLCN